MRHPSPDDEGPFTELDSALSRAGAVADDDDDECIPPPTTTRRNLLMSVLFGLAVILLAALIGYTSATVSVHRAARHTDERVAVLERDLQQRRAAAAEQNANRDAQIAELRNLVCVFANHSQPRDNAVEEIRRRYGCTGAPSPTPGPSRTASG